MPKKKSTRRQKRRERKRAQYKSTQARLIPQATSPIKEGTGRLLTGLKLRNVSERHKAGITQLAWSPNGKWLAFSTALSPVIRVWDAEKDEIHSEIEPEYPLSVEPDDTNYQDVLSPSNTLLTERQNLQEVLASHTTDPDIEFQRERVFLHDEVGTLFLAWERTTTIGSIAFYVNRLEWSSDSKTLAVIYKDGIIAVWEMEAGKMSHKALPFQAGPVYGLAWSPINQTLALVTKDEKITFWNVDSGEWHQTSEEGIRSLGYQDRIVFQIKPPRTSIPAAWSPNGQVLAVASVNKTIELWNAETGERYKVLRGHLGFPGHYAPIFSLVWSPNGKTLASASDDKTVRIWDSTGGQSASILEGHTGSVDCVSFSADGSILASKSLDGTVRLWRSDTWETVTTLKESSSSKYPQSLAFHPKEPILATLDETGMAIRIWDVDYEALLTESMRSRSVRYRNAKVVLVGDTGVGKSGLGRVLAKKKFLPTKSTHGRHVWSLGIICHKEETGLEELREILLWDLAGQAEYRLVHQLSLDQISIALVLFDGSSPIDPFKGVEFWNKALRQAKNSEHLLKYLVGARIDVSPLTVTEKRVKTEADHLGFDGVFFTSAYTGRGIRQLRNQIEASIDWTQLPVTVSEVLFKRMKDFIVAQKSMGTQHRKGSALTTVPSLISQFQKQYPKVVFKDEEFEAALSRVEAHDLVKSLSFGDYVLLEPELLDNYASAMARAAREQPDGLGYLDEQAAREGWFDFGSLKRVKKEDERIILQATVELFIERELAIADAGSLVFPSQFNRELPEYPELKGVIVAYEIEGAIVNIYTTLVVRLYHSSAFVLESLWKNAALFIPYGVKEKNQKCGFIFRELSEGRGRLTIFFGKLVTDATKLLFLKYIHEHLRRKALNGQVQRDRIYRCPKCQREVKDREAVKFRLEQGEMTIPCLYCLEEIVLTDLIEENFGRDDELLAAVRYMDDHIDSRVASESRGMILVGKFMTLVGEAGQIFRPISSHDWDIDGEVEFKDQSGQVTGERIYVQLKVGEAFLGNVCRARHANFHS